MTGASSAEEMYQRYCDGDLTLQEVAKEFGLTRQRVWQTFKRRGWSMHRRGPEIGRGAWRDQGGC